MPWQVEKIIEITRELVLNPEISNVPPLFLLSFVNEILSILPLGLMLASQMVFLEGPLSLMLLIKLLLFIAIPVSIGVSLGSIFIYGLAYWGGKPAIDRFGKYARISWNDVEKMEKRFNRSRSDEIVFLAMRCMPFFPNVPVTAAVGIFRMHIGTFLVLTFVGTTIRIMLMMAVAGITGTGLF